MYREQNDLMTRYIGLSTDDKPANCDHGSSFYEMDTGKTYHYDEEAGNWVNTPDPYSDLKSQISALFETKTMTGALVRIDVDDVSVLAGVSPMPEKLVVAGTNLWDEQWETGTYGTSTGNFNPTTNNICSKRTNPIPIQPNKELSVLCPYNMGVFYYDADDIYISYEVVAPSNPVATTPANAYLMRFYVVSNYGATYNNDLQITYNDCPDKATYHRYVGRVMEDFATVALADRYNYVYAEGVNTSLTLTVDDFKNIYETSGKKKYEAGYIHFTVPVNQTIVDDSLTTDGLIDSESSVVDVDCILSLPTTYSHIGLPTKLIMLCHGAGRGVYGNDTAYDAQGDWRQITGYNNLVSAFNSAGYAVFDCNGYANTQQGCSFWGAQRGVEAWRKAYDYVVRNYNVEENVSIYAFSMGGATALNLAFRNFPNIKCIALGSPVTTLDETTYEHAGAAAFNAAYGINAYDATALTGNDPMQNVVEIDSTDYCFKPIAPLKIWFGGNETWPDPSDAQRLVTAIKNAGGKADLRICSGRGHGISYGEIAYVVSEIVMYINRFND